jgi:acyl-CoA thioesterase-2
MKAAIDNWLSALALDELAPGVYRGFAAPGRRQRTFGGMSMGQALVAATGGVDTDRLIPRSVHCEFVRAGDPKVPIDYDVAATSDSRNFATRAVRARQSDRVLFDMLVRFHALADGAEFQREVPDDAPAPESLPEYQSHLAPYADKAPDWAAGDLPIDVRIIDPATSDGQRAWIRIGDGTVGGRLGACAVAPAVVRACGLLYAGDMTLSGTAVLPFGRHWTDADVQLASLDHAIWFHRDTEIDDWLLYDQRVLSVAGSRALAIGQMYDAAGTLVATVAQDGLLRFAQARVDPPSTI